MGRRWWSSGGGQKESGQSPFEDNAACYLREGAEGFSIQSDIHKRRAADSLGCGQMQRPISDACRLHRRRFGGEEQKQTGCAARHAVFSSLHGPGGAMQADGWRKEQEVGALVPAKSRNAMGTRMGAERSGCCQVSWVDAGLDCSSPFAGWQPLAGRVLRCAALRRR